MKELSLLLRLISDKVPRLRGLSDADIDALVHGRVSPGNFFDVRIGF